MRIDQDVNMVGHQNPSPKPVQSKLPLAELKGNTLSDTFIEEPARTASGSIQLPINDRKCLPRAL